MPLNKTVAKHEVEIAELKSLHKQLDKAMIALTNKQAETSRQVAALARTVERFVRSLSGANGHRQER